jgi:hypothetical protein
VKRTLALLAVVAVVAGCTSSRPHQTPAAPTTTSVAGAPPPNATSATGATSASSATTPAGLIAALPNGCGAGLPGPGAVLTFVAGGRAWAVAPGDASSLRCLFPVTDPGPWSWGPRGDRVLLDGLAVRGVETTLSRPPGNFDPSYFSWSRPTGTTVVYSDQSQTDIRRADMGSNGSQDITPIPGATYGDMAYHPSGLAIGFVAAPPGGSQGIWMSTNTGKDPQQLVFADEPGTTIGHIVFAHDGIGLFYSVDTSAGSHTLARYVLTTGAVERSLWSGTAPIDDITELANVPGVALTVGAQCTDRKAVFSNLDGTGGQVLDPGVPGPVSVVGRLDADRFVVSVGGCNGSPSDLYVVHRSSVAPSLIVRGVTTAAMRTPEPTPPPPLPQQLPRSAEP